MMPNHRGFEIHRFSGEEDAKRSRNGSRQDRERHSCESETVHRSLSSTHGPTKTNPRLVAGGASSTDRLTESKNLGKRGNDVSSIDGTIEGPWSSNWASS